MARDVGDIERITFTYFDADNNPADPGTVVFDFTKPDGTTTHWTVTAGEVVKDSVGVYHADLALDQAGIWVYTSKGSGTGPNASESGSFDVGTPPASFATPEELSTWIGSTVDTARAQFFLDAATEMVRGFLGQSLEERKNDVYTAQLNYYTDLILLPADHVTSVAAVVEDGTTLASGTDYYVSGPAVRRINSYWVLAPKAVVITYDHGYTDIPDDVKGVVLGAAARVYTNSQLGATLPNEGYQPIEARGWSPELVLSMAERAVLARYALLEVGVG